MIDQNKYYSTKQVADMLNINQQHLSRRMREWKFPWSKVGSVYRVKWEDLNNFLLQK